MISTGAAGPIEKVNFFEYSVFCWRPLEKNKNKLNYADSGDGLQLFYRGSPRICNRIIATALQTPYKIPTPCQIIKPTDLFLMVLHPALCSVMVITGAPAAASISH